MHILIMGCGYLGSYLLKNETYSFSTLDKNKLTINSPYKHYEIDASDIYKLEEVIKKESPDIVIDTAANKYIDKCEENVNSSINDNIITVQNIVKLKDKYNFKLIYISTDKSVFPSSVYGAEKMIAERLVLQNNGTVVRLVNILNSTGSILPRWRDLISKNLPITVRGKRTSRYMMTVEDACDVIYKSFQCEGKIIVPKNIKKVNIYKLAKSMTNDIIVENLPTFEKVNEQINWNGENIICI